MDKFGKKGQQLQLWQTICAILLVGWLCQNCCNSMQKMVGPIHCVLYIWLWGLLWLGCTLRSWIHAIFSHYSTVSSRLGDNYVSKCSSNNFPHKFFLTMCGKLLELHFKPKLVSNRGEKVMKWKTTVWQICLIVFLAFQTFSPGLDNK